tara:strand:- start:726 stop:959 length:234 start_codon:yes stop_codon:yes gene_type:complete
MTKTYYSDYKEQFYSDEDAYNSAFSKIGILSPNITSVNYNTYLCECCGDVHTSCSIIVTSSHNAPTDLEVLLKKALG